MSIPSIIKFNGERTFDNRCLKFDVKWMDGDNTKESIYSFLDFSEKSINDSFSFFAKNIYKTYKGDNCWFCSSNVCIQNNCVCEHHYKKCNWVIEHFNNMVQEDFNSEELVLEEEPLSPSPNNIIYPSSPPPIRRMKTNDNINFNYLNQRNIDFEKDNIEDFEIIEPPEEPDNFIFTMI